MTVTAYAAALAVIVPWCAGIPDLSGQETLRGIIPLIPAFLCGFLNGAFWALAGSAAAVLTRNHYLGYAVPFILYYVLTVFQERYYAKLYALSPRQWAYPSYFGAGFCAGILILLIAGCGAVSCEAHRKEADRMIRKICLIAGQNFSGWHRNARIWLTFTLGWCSA